VALKNEINKLRKEAEVYNNPQSYVKYAKLERNITKLQKQLDDIVMSKPKEENDDFSKMAIYNFAIQILFYLVNAVFIFWFKDQEFVIPCEDSNCKNIVFNYFRKDENSRIPVYLILIMQGIFFSKLLDNLNKFKLIFV